MPGKAKVSKRDSSANLGFEAKLWLAADSRSAAETAEGNRCNNMDAADYIRAERDRLPEATSRVDLGQRTIPRSRRTDFVGVQCFINHLAPQGMAGFVLANGPAVAGSSNQSGEGDRISTTYPLCA